MVICQVPSSVNNEGENLIGTVHHPNWILFASIPVNKAYSPRVSTYINICLSLLHFSLCRDIINHPDILLMSFTNNHVQYFIINIYSDSFHLALKYLKDIEVNINNVLIMMGDFNIRDSLWDLFFPHHSAISDDLFIIADSYNLAISTPTKYYPTRYSDTTGKADFTIDLMFLRNGSSEINQHSIHPDWRLISDYAPLTIVIPIEDEIIKTSKLLIQQKSKVENAFLEEVISSFKNFNMSNITSKEVLEHMVNKLNSIVNQVWNKNAKHSRITKHSKKWWSEEYNKTLTDYRSTRSLNNWKIFKKVVKDTKRAFFDLKIQEVAEKSHSLWELTSWINKQKLPATKAIKHEGQPCLTLENLWNALHSTFNIALHRQVNIDIFNKLSPKPITVWAPFLKEEFRQVLNKCNNSSAPGPDKLTWRHLKIVLNLDSCMSHIVNIANACINLGHSPNHFKQLSMVIIPKPNKMAYDSSKSFRPIVLLNTIGKLIEKVIAECLQFHVAKNNFIHPSQLGGLKFKSITDAGVTLTHIIRSGWIKNKTTSILAFDITQFFPSLNHHMLVLFLAKVGLELKVTSFFEDFLVKRKTNYTWNEFSSQMFKVNVGVGQGFVLSPILSALYLSPLLYILEKRLKTLKILVSLLSFVDDGLLISQNKSIDISNSQLFCSYNILSSLLDKFGLNIEHSKTEMFHFNRSHGTFNPPPLDLSPLVLWQPLDTMSNNLTNE